MKTWRFYGPNGQPVNFHRFCQKIRAMHNIIQTILHDFVQSYPQPGQPAQLELSVGTHDPDRDNSKFRLSDAGKCRLMRYWKRQGKAETRDIPPEVLLQMQAGHIIHAYIERAAHEMGCLVSSEDKLEDEHRIGHFDLIVSHPLDESERILYDIKTITSKKAYYKLRDGKEADDQHIAQLVSYAMMYEDRLDALRIAYVIRDTMAITEIPIDMPLYEDNVIVDWDILISAWNRQEPPTPNPKKWECRYCAYSADCPSAIR
jgi:CRISPR/Cas system-associated exonuclease Cas4 (RecB family)